MAATVGGSPSESPGPKPPLVKLLELIPQASGAWVILVALVVIVGWHVHSLALIQVLPDFPPMQYNTALCFALCGMGLILLQTGFTRVASWLGLLVSLIGALTVLEYSLNADFGIDQFFFISFVHLVGAVPGRMSPLTAGCFVSIGAALVQSNSGGLRVKLMSVGLLACLAAMITGVALSGYAFGIETVYGWGVDTRMAVLTAANFLILSIGLLSWSWQRASRENFDFIRWLPVTAAAALMGMIAITACVSFAQLKSSTESRSHSFEILSTAEAFLDDMYDTTRGMRGYVLTGHPGALKIFQTGAEEGPQELGRLAELVQDNPAQLQRVMGLKADFDQVLAYSRHLIDLRNERGLQAAIGLESEGQGFAELSATLSDLKVFNDEEHQILNERSTEEEISFRNTARLVVSGSALAAALLILANLLASREVNFRRRAERELHDVALMQKAILNSANYAMISADLKGTILSFNETAERWLGYSAAEIIGKPSAELWHDRDEVIATAKELSRELGRKVEPGFEVFVAKVGPGQTDEREWTYIRKDGSRFPVLLSVSALPDVTGKVAGYLGVIADISARKKMEQELERNRARLTGILNNSLDGVIAHEAIRNEAGTIQDFRFILVNPAAERLSETAASNMIGRRLLDVFPSVLENGLFEKFVSIVESGKTLEFEHFSSRTTPPKWFRIAGTKLGDGLSLSYMDITGRKQSEAEILSLNNALEGRVESRTRQLSESEKRARFLAEAMPQIIWTATPEGNVDYCNQRWFEYTGLTLEETRGWGWAALLHPDDAERTISAWKKAFGSGLPYEDEYRFKRASDGMYRWHLNRAFPLRNDGGEIVQWVGTSTDIDEIKQAEEKIRKINEGLERRVAERTAQLLSLNKNLEDDIEQRKQLEKALSQQARILDLANDTIFVRDFDDRITYWNQGAQRAYGWSRDESVGRITHDLLKTEFPVPLKEIRAQLMTQGHWEGELLHTRRDGTKLNMVSRWSLQRDDEGKPFRIIEMNFDITQRKKMERVLNEKNIELEKAAQAKNSFLANMSHELRTPLNAIIGFSEILADGLSGEVNAEQKEFLGDILTSGQHLLQLINDVLDLAKVEAGKMEFHPETFAIRTLIEQVCSVAYPLLQKKKIQLITTIAPEVDSVTLDEQKLKQVLYNLLSNAVKFTDDGGRVEIRVMAAGSQNFTLAVSDTGIGIKPENLGRLFNDFEQLDGGATRKYQGTGLGLSLTRKIAERQGGRILVESFFGKGTTFTVILPLRAVEPVL